MVGYILGNYLVDTGRITKEQARVIFDSAGKVRVKLGLIAVAEGYMTAEEAEEVNRLQALMDKRFGDIAVEKKYLTEDQVGLLLQKQGNEYMIFLQTLVDLGIMDMAAADNVLRDYQNANGLTDAQCEDLKSGDVDRILPIFLPEEADRYKEIFGVAIRTLIRCIDREVSVGKAEMADGINGKNGSFQMMEAKDGNRIYVGLVEVDGGFLTTASIFAGEEFAEVDEDALDSCAELLNCINGLYASAKSKESVELELCPPSMYSEDTLLSGQQLCVLPVMVKGNAMKCVVYC